MDWKLELVTVPVADVDRAIGFYTDQIGFTLDYDHQVDERIDSSNSRRPVLLARSPSGPGSPKLRPDPSLGWN